MVPLYDVTDVVGGLTVSNFPIQMIISPHYIWKLRQVCMGGDTKSARLQVVPNTHKNDWKDRYKYLKGRGDWCTVSGRLDENCHASISE